MLINSLTSNSNEKKLGSLQEYFYSNLTLSKEEKIQLEQRRRNQISKTFDYLLSNITYFDFFSLDIFQITKQAKKISIYYNFKNINNDSLLFSFIYSSTELNKLLEEYGINKDSLHKIFPYFLSISKNKKITLLQKIRSYITKNITASDIKFSYETNLLFEKASENAILRFKTPIITSEILFITLLEEKNNKVIKSLKKIIGNDLSFQLLRYKILKRIHKEESSIREEISKNQYYFAYLLKTQLTDIEFDRLLSNEILQEGVSLFRNTIIYELLKLNITNLLLKDIHVSIEGTNTRVYSK